MNENTGKCFKPYITDIFFIVLSLKWFLFYWFNYFFHPLSAILKIKLLTTVFLITFLNLLLLLDPYNSVWTVVFPSPAIINTSIYLSPIFLVYGCLSGAIINISDSKYIYTFHPGMRTLEWLGLVRLPCKWLCHSKRYNWWCLLRR